MLQKRLNVCHLSISDSDGGAAIAAMRIFRVMSDHGVGGDFFCSVSSSDKKSVSVHRVLAKQKSYFCRILDFILSKILKKKKFKVFSFNLYTESSRRLLNEVNQYDAVIVYWVGAGFLSPRFIGNIKIPIVWRLSDTWAFTGGCHYPGDCNRFMVGCGECPQLANELFNVTKHLNAQKEKAFKDVIVACPSLWIKKMAKSSNIFKNNRIVHIRTGVDTAVIKPSARSNNLYKKYGLDKNKLTLCFGAADSLGDPRKGGQFLLELLQRLDKRAGFSYQAFVFGNHTNHLEHLSDKIVATGIISSQEDLANIYSLGDIFIAPYMEDNLPNTIIESLSCGTPVLSFEIGGIPELVIHKENGYLARPYSIDSLEAGLHYIIDNLKELKKHTREHILEGFRLEQQVCEYMNLLQGLVVSSPRAFKK